MDANYPFDVVKDTIKRAFEAIGMDEAKAEVCATVHAQSSADGIESHGLNRVPRFVTYVRQGMVDLAAEPELVASRGVAENYDGHRGVGVTNALFCADRAIELAREHGIGVVTLRNTTHWMRGGTYAWHMADAGFMGICWTNTESVMPAWGSDEQSVGNNPFCIAIPHGDAPVVVDMAMSQYSYGKLGMLKLAGKKLPYPGGFDAEGNLSSDPGAIQASRRLLPTGYWKGSSLALALDLAAAMLADGRCGTDIDAKTEGSCGGCSQVFMAFDPNLFGDEGSSAVMVERRLEALHSAHPEHEGDTVAYPGEHTLERRKRSMSEGVHVDGRVWDQVCQIAQGDFEVLDIA
ncbi:3-dehydro-L-gulonate 2-dehydrogenase [Collinsella tanakaei]|uniref:3-dehydro-L-gulonate 2-dehydrogenase n=1 Tax=Collinsella tanakaei TaxID=626935 RepID=UPI0025A49675|nr:3-dehydro-L-gulonate 2-dehydrogenase [Collinsella tanakaei]MDM8300457.1 3-dehydro-L-gulonate 2-dehydrogenase [Collinsella tanakaei]